MSFKVSSVNGYDFRMVTKRQERRADLVFSHQFWTISRERYNIIRLFHYDHVVLL